MRATIRLAGGLTICLDAPRRAAGYLIRSALPTVGASQIRGQARVPGRRHPPCIEQPTGHRSVLRGPVRAGPTRDESDRVSLGVDPTGLRVDPAMAQRHFLELLEGDGLSSRCLVVDRDEHVPIAGTVLGQPGIQLGRLGDRDRVGKIDSASRSPYQSERVALHSAILAERALPRRSTRSLPQGRVDPDLDRGAARIHPPSLTASLRSAGKPATLWPGSAIPRAPR